MMSTTMESYLNPSLPHNITVFVTEVDEVAVIPGTGVRSRDEEYDQFLADVWVGVVLTLMVLSCVCCVCSCLLYHKFQQWKRSVLESRAQNTEAGGAPLGEIESLPSYTIVSGLPTYDEALEQLRRVNEQRTDSKSIEAQTQEQCMQNNENQQQQEPLARLSAAELLQSCKSYHPE